MLAVDAILARAHSSTGDTQPGDAPLTSKLIAKPASVKLAAGPLKAEFNGRTLRYIRYGNEEVIRAISFLVRDENWGTHALALADLELQQTEASFEVRFHGSCGPAGAELNFTAQIAGCADGRLTFTVQTTLRGPLLTNRTGFVILHPISVSGKPVIVESVDGRRRCAHFPEQIDPPVWLANLGPDSQSVDLRLPAGCSTIIRWLHDAAPSTAVVFFANHVVPGPGETIAICSGA